MLYVSRVTLQNVRCFERLDVDLSVTPPGAGWTVLVGDNATGKSTFLRSIAMGLCDEASAAGLLKESDEGYIRRGASKARIAVSLYNPRIPSRKYRIVTEVVREEKRRKIFADRVRQRTTPSGAAFPWDEVFVSGYGAGRGVSGASDISSYSAIDAVYNMFNYTEGLQNPELVIRRLAEKGARIPIDQRQVFKVHTPSGRAAGRVEQLEGLLEALRSHKGRYDAVAVSSVIDLPEELHQGYFDAGGEMVNPWGGVEAMLTHGLSNVFGVPTAHSPMFESRKIANADPGIVDPRMAAEAVSLTFLQCTLKGLRQSPRIVTNIEAMRGRDVLTADSVSCVVVPQGCLGIPVVAALKQSIMVIAVRENRNLMRNDLSRLPWALGQYVEVENYWEAAGVIAAVRSGIDPASVRRPLERTKVSRMAASNVPDGTLSSIE